LLHCFAKFAAAFSGISAAAYLRGITDKFAAHIQKMYIGLAIQPSTLGGRS
jgi:hypothetical protein